MNLQLAGPRGKMGIDNRGNCPIHAMVSAFSVVLLVSSITDTNTPDNYFLEK